MMIAARTSLSRRSRWRRCGLLLLLLATVTGAAPAAAQSGGTPAPAPLLAVRYAAAVVGDTARVKLVEPQGTWRTGVLTRVVPDSIELLRKRQRGLLVIHHANVLQLQVVRGTRPSRLAMTGGAIAGGVAGGLLGAVAVARLGCLENCSENDFIESAAIGLGIGAVLGGFAGGRFAARVQVPRWVTVAP